jgi:hypothetical protein
MGLLLGQAQAFAGLAPDLGLLLPVAPLPLPLLLGQLLLAV